MPDVRVMVVSPEEASHGVAELWIDGELVGFTRFEGSELVVHVEQRRDGAPIVLGVRSLTLALAQAAEVLARY